VYKEDKLDADVAECAN